MRDLVDACSAADDAAVAVRKEIALVAAELFGEFGEKPMHFTQTSVVKIAKILTRATVQA